MRLLLADDHTLFRDALLRYFEREEPGIVVELAKDTQEAIDLIKGFSYDLILLDLKMPGMNGMEGLKAIQDVSPKTPIALISGVAESADVRTAIHLGARGYIPKTLPGKSMIKAVKAIMAGEIFIPMDDFGHSPQASYYEHDQARPSERREIPKLSRRESEVLGYLEKGASNKEIALALGLQLVTIKLHVRGVCRKLGVKNRTQAALMARDFIILKV